jgi:hypothetical protein
VIYKCGAIQCQTSFLFFFLFKTMLSEKSLDGRMTIIVNASLSQIFILLHTSKAHFTA